MFIGKKQKANQIFGFFPSRGTAPHITIADIECWPHHQAKIISEIEHHHPKTGYFNVEVVGFADYEKYNYRVIHLLVEKKEFDTLGTYHKRMKKILELYKKKYYVSESPHITIARNLNQDVWESAKKEYLSRLYQSSFTANAIKILYREIVNKAATRYQEFDEIQLLERTFKMWARRDFPECVRDAPSIISV